jgi:DNA-binding NtrC family response regulator
MASILIIDDDAQLRDSFEKLLTSEGYDIRVAATGEAGLEIAKTSMPDLAILDLRLPGMDGLETFEALHDLEPKLPVIIMTAYGAAETAIKATKLGAFDYVLKPFDIPDILGVIDKALQTGRFMRSRVEMDATPAGARLAPPADAILGRSRAMQELYKAIGRVAPTDATVLIRGESGTGKELAARAVYQHSLRSLKPFMVINCVAIPETLLESELFGYEKGAFTGAMARKLGKIEQANHGTVFLDEIGDMPFSIQSKILRLLQERSIERLGGASPISVDVRVIAATNRNLEEALGDGRFREDLYYRLKVVTLLLPPLRERVSDISMLADYFLSRYAKDMHSSCPGFTERAKAEMRRYEWPGNVRELANTVQKAIIFSRGLPISDKDIAHAIEGERSARPSEQADEDETLKRWVRKSLMQEKGDKAFGSLMDRFTGLVIAEALTVTQGNRSQAARLLGLSRPTLLSKIEKYGIKISTEAASAYTEGP